MANEERARWALHLAKPLETQTVEGLTTKWVRDLARELVDPTPGTRAPDGRAKEAISGPTAHRVLTLLSSFYGWAICEGLVETNPVRPALRDPDVKALLKSSHDKDDAPHLKSWADVDRLYAGMARSSVGIAYYLQARAGLRPGEAVALRWGDVDLAAKTLTIRRNVRHGKEGPTKGGKPRRVPVAPKLAEELAAWRMANPHADHDLVAPPPFLLGPGGKPSTERMGRFLGPKSITKALAAAFKSSKTKPGTAYAYGRHTFASLVALSGAVSAPRLQAILGHQDIKTTLRYVSLANQALTQAELAAFG
jgi:integrase